MGEEDWYVMTFPEGENAFIESIGLRIISRERLNFVKHSVLIIPVQLISFPIAVFFSKIPTCNPSFARRYAVWDPTGPAPTTMTSCGLFTMVRRPYPRVYHYTILSRIPPIYYVSLVALLVMFQNFY
jgi:hypothetical protein